MTEALQSTEPQNAAGALQGLMQAVIEKGGDAAGVAAALKDLVVLYREEQDRAAAREFAHDFAEFQAECPPVPKTSTSKGANEPGAKFTYTYAELDEVAATVGPHLHKRGLSYTWDSEVDAGIVKATCTLRHRNGHSISAKFQAPIDASQRMNETQKYASALTYARRQSLVQVLGLTTTDADTDVRPENLERISPDQTANLRALISDTKSDVNRFLDLFGHRNVEEITVAEYPRALRALEQKALAQRKVKASE